MTENPHLISPAELSARLGESGLSIVDASWYLPAQNCDPRAEFEAGHVPGAVFLDQDAVVDPSSTLPHTLPSADIFGEALGRMGVSSEDEIVVYDGAGLFSAARGWWMLRTFGARKVRVLDGGLPAWRANGGALETGPSEKAPARFDAVLDESAVVRLDEMKRIVDEAGAQIADARSGERFRAEAPEPRAGVRGGHMPGARSLPITELIDKGRLKSADELEKAFAEAGVDPDGEIVTSCGSGVTAAIINLALASTGRGPGRLYDGSWTEWGSAPDTPVETGPARN